MPIMSNVAKIGPINRAQAPQAFTDFIVKPSVLYWQIWIISTHLKLWIASARHNFKWVKISIKEDIHWIWLLLKLWRSVCWQSRWELSVLNLTFRTRQHVLVRTMVLPPASHATLANRPRVIRRQNPDLSHLKPSPLSAHYSARSRLNNQPEI